LTRECKQGPRRNGQGRRCRRHCFERAGTSVQCRSVKPRDVAQRHRFERAGLQSRRRRCEPMPHPEPCPSWLHREGHGPMTHLLLELPTQPPPRIWILFIGEVMLTRFCNGGGAHVLRVGDLPPNRGAPFKFSRWPDICGLRILAYPDDRICSAKTPEFSLLCHTSHCGKTVLGLCLPLLLVELKLAEHIGFRR